jgi:ABC-type Co2+ transport system permease subunit
MHIELGLIAATKLAFANAGAIATLAINSKKLITKPNLIIKTALAAVFFTAFMQAFHMPIGASELHFIGASAVYLMFGFLPTLFGFALGLLLQALIFEPADMLHLGVNILSLSIPLIGAHALYGKKFFAKNNKQKVSWSTIVRFDAIYYSGVIGMVAFWLFIGSEPTPFYSWAIFAIAYLPLVFIEPIFTFIMVRLTKHYAGRTRLNKLNITSELKLS